MGEVDDNTGIRGVERYKHLVSRYSNVTFLLNLIVNDNEKVRIGSRSG